MLSEITPLILTYNESPNIERTLGKLQWAADIVVVDSCSTDETAALARRDPRVRLFERRFTTHTEQWNFGLTQTGIATEWVLALDADYVLSEPLVAEIRGTRPASTTNGYEAPFRYCVDGQPLRSGVYPNNIVLFRRTCATYWQDGHTQRVRVPGPVLRLRNHIFHDDRKPLSHWLGAQFRYMRLEAKKLSATPFSGLSLSDKLRRLIVLAPIAIPCYCLVVRRGVLDGRAGLIYAMQRAIAEAILSLCLLQQTQDE